MPTHNTFVVEGPVLPEAFPVIGTLASLSAAGGSTTTCSVTTIGRVYVMWGGAQSDRPVPGIRMARDFSERAPGFTRLNYNLGSDEF